METKINRLIIYLLFIGIAFLVIGIVIIGINWMFDNYCDTQNRVTPAYCKEALK